MRGFGELRVMVREARITRRNSSVYFMLTAYADETPWRTSMVAGIGGEPNSDGPEVTHVWQNEVAKAVVAEGDEIIQLTCIEQGHVRGRRAVAFFLARALKDRPRRSHDQAVHRRTPPQDQCGSLF